MQIHLRQSGSRQPAIIIEHVKYFEPLVGFIQYTVTDCDMVLTLDITPQGDIIYQGVVYDWCQVYA